MIKFKKYIIVIVVTANKLPNFRHNKKKVSGINKGHDRRKSEWQRSRRI